MVSSISGSLPGSILSPLSMPGSGSVGGISVVGGGNLFSTPMTFGRFVMRLVSSVIPPFSFASSNDLRRARGISGPGSVSTGDGAAGGGDPSQSPAPKRSRDRYGIHRELYQRHFRELSVHERVAAAISSSGDTLVALCFDPTIEVVRAVLSNSQSGLPHARLIATHHHTAAGLDLLTHNRSYATDTAVRSALLKNTVTPRYVFDRILQSSSLQQLFGICRGREATHMGKTFAREKFRKKFETSSPEERANFIIRNEGRCLQYLIGIHLGRPTFNILCTHNYTSEVLILNLLTYASP
ncbi:MAG: hypothetical protein HN337_00150, partial [Deltaproteobacteria bacterium]|nr:hypothetical protein [Deltaproteobacteria bacterium]